MDKEVIFISTILATHPIKIVSQKHPMVHQDLIGCLDAPSYIPAGSMCVSMHTNNYSFVGPSFVARGIDASTVKQWVLDVQNCLDDVPKIKSVVNTPVVL